MGAKSMTRFTVEGSTYWDTARQAITEARRLVYVSPEAAERAVASLEKGEDVTLVYGFVSVFITPPRGA